MESLKTGGLPLTLLAIVAAGWGCTARVSDGGSAAGGPGSGGLGGQMAGQSGGAAQPGQPAQPNVTPPTGTPNQPPVPGQPGGSGGSSAPVSPEVVVPSKPANPGVLVVRRLNQTEYNNTVRDLLGTSLKPANEFPADDLGGEFDTVGSALSLSPAYVTAYEKSAHLLMDDLLAAEPTRRQRVLTCNVETAGDTCARTVLGAFARKAWRRPVTPAEVEELMRPVTTARQLGAPPLQGLKHALAAALLSPYFLFKLEIDADPTSTQPRRLTAHELATRLSYALWATMPDDGLSSAADAARLSTDAEVTSQLDRMLADPRADALLDNFAADWLEFRHLEDHEVDAVKFPRYTPALAQSMKKEARRFVQEFLRSDMPINGMLNSRFTFLDSALATHYGLGRTAPAGTAAGDFVRVDTTAAQRAGLLTLGAFLTTTSFSSRTSPVLRGQFVFSKLLCGTVNLPPGDVPTLPEDPTLTGRKLAEQHRSKPECMPCHVVMDPIGFGLENFDAIGAYRTKDGTADVDATGTLPDGSQFNGAIELANILGRDPRFGSCVTNKFMTFAVGRLLDSNSPNDKAWVAHLASEALKSGGSLRGIIRTVVLSDAFRTRQAAAPAVN